MLFPCCTDNTRTGQKLYPVHKHAGNAPKKATKHQARRGQAKDKNRRYVRPQGVAQLHGG